MIDFYVGQKVVCVDASPLFLGGNIDGLRERSTYTIRWFGEDEDGDVVVRLQEIRRSPLRRSCAEMGFLATRFRPLTDISVFTAMLTPAPADTREAADAE